MNCQREALSKHYKIILLSNFRIYTLNKVILISTRVVEMFKISGVANRSNGFLISALLISNRNLNSISASVEENYRRELNSGTVARGRINRKRVCLSA